MLPVLYAGNSVTQKAPRFILHPTVESHGGDSEDASRKAQCKHQRDALNLFRKRTAKGDPEVGMFGNF